MGNLFQIILATFFLIVTVVVSIPLENNKQAALSEEAKQYLEELNAIYLEKANAQITARWNYVTQITDDTAQAAATANTEFLKYQAEKRSEIITRFPDYEGFEDDVKRELKYLLIQGSGDMPENNVNRMNALLIEMERSYVSTTVCHYNTSGDNCEPLKLEDIEEQLRTKTDFAELEHYFTGWHNKVNERISADQYAELVELQNEMARANGFNDMSEMWIAPYIAESSNWAEGAKQFKEDMVKAWDELQDIYATLAEYVTIKLRATEYGSKITSEGLPANIFGSMWAQDWSALDGLTKPYQEVPSLDVTNAMNAKGYTVQKMREISEDYFVNLGLEAYSSWGSSIFERPQGVEFICQPSAVDFYKEDDFRIKMCANVNMKDLATMQNQMGHIQYMQKYTSQHYIFRNGANPGFQDAVGEAIALAFTNPYHLQCELDLDLKIPDLCTVQPTTTEDSGPTTTTEDSGPTTTTEDSGPTTTTEDSGPTATTEDSGPTATTEDSGPTTTTEDSGPTTTTEDSGPTTTTEDSGPTTTTEDSGPTTTTEDSGPTTTTEDSGPTTTTEDTGPTTTTEDSGPTTTTEDSGPTTTTEDSGPTTTTEDSGPTTTTEDSGPTTTTEDPTTTTTEDPATTTTTEDPATTTTTEDPGTTTTTEDPATTTTTEDPGTTTTTDDPATTTTTEDPATTTTTEVPATTTTTEDPATTTTTEDPATTTSTEDPATTTTTEDPATTTTTEDPATTTTTEDPATTTTTEDPATTTTTEDPATTTTTENPEFDLESNFAKLFLRSNLFADLGKLSHKATNGVNQVDQNFLYLMQLQKYAFIPFGIAVEDWRWKVFSGEIKKEDYNKKWWEIRKQYQGIVPPTPRPDTVFDPAANYHIAANIPSIGDFVSHILQFQFYEAMCKAAGEYDPNDADSHLFKCNLNGKEAVGPLLSNMMQLGFSKHWTEALKIITGKETLDVSSIKSFYAPIVEEMKDYIENSKKGDDDDGSNTAAIIVGCILGAAVVVVVIGYFIGKRMKK